MCWYRYLSAENRQTLNKPTGHNNISKVVSVSSNYVCVWQNFPEVTNFPYFFSDE